MIKSFLSYLDKNVFLKTFFLILVIIFLIEIPINNWLSFIVFIYLIIIILFNKIIINQKNFLVTTIVILISIIVKIITPSSIDEGFFVYPTKNYQISNEILPKKVNNFVKDLVNKQYDVEIKSKISWSFSGDGIWQKKDMSRKIKNINFDNIYEEKIGAFNDVAMQINHKNWSPYSLRLPLVIKYVLPESYINSEICFRGLIYYDNNFYNNKEFKCKNTYVNINELYAFDIKSLPNLSIHLKSSNFLDQYSEIISYLNYFMALFLLFLFTKFNYFSVSLTLLGLFNYFIFLIDLVFKENLPSKFSPFIYMGRGNDGLMHYGYGREIAKYITEGNFFMTLRGGVDVFHWMPGMRYFFALTFFIFGETNLGYILIGILFPFIIYSLLKKLFNNKIAKILTFIFLIIPIFESYGFLSFYYMKLIAKGFGGTLGWFCLIASINLLLNKNILVKKNNFFQFFIIGLLFVILISCRPNLLPTAFILLFGFIIYSIFKKNYYNAIGLFLGGSSFFLFVLHNYYYGMTFDLITNSSSTLRNMPISPDLWITLIKQILIFNIDIDLLLKLLRHVSIWINFYEIWLMVCILSLFLIILSNKIEVQIKIISLSLLAGHSIYILYAGVPRYTYGLWLLSFVFMLYYFNLKFEILDKIVQWHTKVKFFKK